MVDAGTANIHHDKNIGCLSTSYYDTIEDGPNKTSHCLLSLLVKMMLFLYFDRVIYLGKIWLHHSIHVICIITSPEKEMFQSRGFVCQRSILHAACYGLGVYKRAMLETHYC